MTSWASWTSPDSGTLDSVERGIRKESLRELHAEAANYHRKRDRLYRGNAFTTLEYVDEVYKDWAPPYLWEKLGAALFAAKHRKKVVWAQRIVSYACGALGVIGGLSWKKLASSGDVFITQDYFEMAVIALIGLVPAVIGQGTLENHKEREKRWREACSKLRGWARECGRAGA